MQLHTHIIHPTHTHTNLARQVYTPTWDEELSLEAKRDGLMRSTYTGVKVVPLMVEPGTVSALYTSDIFPDNLSAASHLCRANLQLWPRTGAPCVCLPHPIENAKKYPHGSFLDLDTFPIWTIHPLCLRQFLEVRGLHLRQKESWRTLMRLLKRALRQKLQPLTLEVGSYYTQHMHTPTSLT